MSRKSHRSGERRRPNHRSSLPPCRRPLLWLTVRCASPHSSVFYNMPHYNDDLSGWNTASATATARMFYKCSSFNSDLSNWHMAGVIDAHWMVRAAISPRSAAHGCEHSRTEVRVSGGMAPDSSTPCPPRSFERRPSSTRTSRAGPWASIASFSRCSGMLHPSTSTCLNGT